MGSRIEVLELKPNGASIAFNDSDAATAVVRAVVEVAQRLTGPEAVQSIGVHAFSDPSLSMSATSVAQLLSKGPFLLCRESRYFTFDLQINDSPPAITVAPLDQGMSGIAFTAYDINDDAAAGRLHQHLKEVFADIAASEPMIEMEGETLKGWLR
jgi:hypothetical protein